MWRGHDSVGNLFTAPMSEGPTVGPSKNAHGSEVGFHLRLCSDILGQTGHSSTPTLLRSQSSQSLRSWPPPPVARSQHPCTRLSRHANKGYISWTNRDCAALSSARMRPKRQVISREYPTGRHTHRIGLGRGRQRLGRTQGQLRPGHGAVIVRTVLSPRSCPTLPT